MSTIEKRGLLLLNTVLSIVLAVLVVTTLRGFGFFSKREAPRAPAAETPRAQISEPGPQAYSIKHEVSAATEASPKALSEVFGHYPKSDTGESPSAAWSQVNPADKEKLAEVLDKSIEDSKAKLANDPGNKKAKKLLFMSENLKKMVAKNFDYSLDAGSAAGKGKSEKK